MAASKKLLVAVDSSAASRRAVNYVAEIAGGNPACQVGLLHLQLPPRMLEWGGAEDAETEEKISSERGEAYRELEANAMQGGNTLLQRLQGVLAKKRVDVADRLVQFEEPLDPKHIAQHVLKLALEENYGTVVVGRHSFSGLKRWFGHHVSEELIRAAKGITVWVVE